MVVAVEGGAGAHGGWGTWEELVLGSAVLRHGYTAWATVADELRTRSPCAFSPEDCEAKFAEIRSRYSACNAWFEELRKQRVAELKRELEESESSIGSLQSVIESLNNSKHGDGSSDCRTTHTESCSHSGNVVATNSSSKDLSRDRSSAASFTEEASNCQKSQQVQRCDTDSIRTSNISTEKSFLKAIDEKVSANNSLFWGSRKQRGRRVGRIVQKVDASSRDSEPISTACTEMEGSSEGCKEDMKKGLNLKAPTLESGPAKKGLKTPNIECDATKKGLKTPNVIPGVMKKGLKTPKLESAPNLESGVMKNSLKTPKVGSGVSEIVREKEKLADIVKFIALQGDSLMLQHQVDIQRKRVAYKKMIRRHMDFKIIHSKIQSGVISSNKELLRDMLIFVNNVIVFYPKATLEHKAAVQLRDIACKAVNQNLRFSTMPVIAPLSKKNAQVTQPGHHSPGDSKGNKVASRDTTVSAKRGEGKGTVSTRQGKGKGSRGDKPPAANLKTVEKVEPAKKRGVGRPPKSGPLKRTAQAPEDSPSRGRKRIRRGP